MHWAIYLAVVGGLVRRVFVLVYVYLFRLVCLRVFSRPPSVVVAFALCLGLFVPMVRSPMANMSPLGEVLGRLCSRGRAAVAAVYTQQWCALGVCWVGSGVVYSSRVGYLYPLPFRARFVLFCSLVSLSISLCCFVAVKLFVRPDSLLSSHPSWPLIRVFGRPWSFLFGLVCFSLSLSRASWPLARGFGPALFFSRSRSLVHVD